VRRATMLVGVGDIDCHGADESTLARLEQRPNVAGRAKSLDMQERGS
jgi:hypothetical protein